MKIQKTIGAAVMSLSLVVGLSGFAGATSGTAVTNTGPHSKNQVVHKTEKKTEVRNNNNIKVESWNKQQASTGDAKSKGNTKGGSATSGSATNSNNTNVSATVNNSASTSAALGSGGTGGSGSGSATIKDTGPHSKNQIVTENKSSVKVENNNNVDVKTNNYQSAYSGDATVYGNTHGGSATSGNASNTNSSSVNVNITN